MYIIFRVKDQVIFLSWILLASLYSDKLLLDLFFISKRIFRTVSSLHRSEKSHWGKFQKSRWQCPSFASVFFFFFPSPCSVFCQHKSSRERSLYGGRNNNSFHHNVLYGVPSGSPWRFFFLVCRAPAPLSSDSCSYRPIWLHFPVLSGLL